MPTTEVPSRPPERPPERTFRRKPSAYDNLDPDELLHLIDQMEDERSRSLRREGIWISVIAHMILFWFLIYGPKVIWHQPHVVNPRDAFKNKKDLTYLNLPPDALKPVKPKPEAPPSDKNRIAQAQHPTLDRKTLEQLQAELRAGQHAPPPAQKAEKTPAPPAPAPLAQAAPQPPHPAPPPPPMAPVQQAQLEAPKPAPTRPNFNQGLSTPGDAIRRALQSDALRANQQPGDYGMNAPVSHSGVNAGVDILSDTMGVDFGPYMQRVIAATYRSWLPMIPESARPPLNKQGSVGIRFKIYPDGSVKQMILEFPSGDVALDRAAWGGITGAAPYPPLPSQFRGPFLELRFGFFYNIDPSKPR